MPAKKPARPASPKQTAPVPVQPMTIPVEPPVSVSVPEAPAAEASALPPEAETTPSPEVKEFASLPTPPVSTPPPPPPSSPPEPVAAPSPSSPPPPSKKWLWIGLGVVLAIGVVVAGYAVLNAVSKKSSPAPTPALSPTPAITPTTSPTTSLQRSQLKLQVLNGSGIPGKAGRVKEFLEGLGYANVEVGNADSYDYQDTAISIKSDKKVYLDLLISDLKNRYSLSDKSASLSADSAYDAAIVVGKN